MVNIILTPEHKGLETLQINVTKKTYKDLKKLQYQGGFKRFGLSVYDDTPKKAKYTEYDVLGEWLKKIFIPCK